MSTASDVLERLKEGNLRFTNGQMTMHNPATLRNQLVAGQHPHAIILGCSDSRVPAEIIFDQYLGDLFVIRVAGNIVAPSQIGSIEFAATQFGTRLVIVLGHSNCGAVQASLNELKNPSKNHSPHLYSIVDRICPAIKTLTETSLKDDPEALIHHAVHANIRASVKHLQSGSPILEKLIADEGLLVIGAEYSLQTGLVEFFDGY